MPEGDTFIERRLSFGPPAREALTGFETTVPQVAAAIARQPVVGVDLRDRARGKHLLIAFRDPDSGPTADLVLHTQCE